MSRPTLFSPLHSPGIRRKSRTPSSPSQQTLAGILLQRESNGKVVASM